MLNNENFDNEANKNPTENELNGKNNNKGTIKCKKIGNYVLGIYEFL